MNDCLFCKIINGDIPSKTIYENDYVKVFMDINPITNGDSLIVTKEHIVTVDEVNEELGIELLKAVKLIKKMLVEKLNCEGVTIEQNNGYGQEIKHFHIHMTPRYTNDMLEHTFNKDMLKEIDEVFETLK